MCGSRPRAPIQTVVYFPLTVTQNNLLTYNVGPRVVGGPPQRVVSTTSEMARKRKDSPEQHTTRNSKRMNSERASEAGSSDSTNEGAPVQQRVGIFEFFAQKLKSTKKSRSQPQAGANAPNKPHRHNTTADGNTNKAGSTTNVSKAQNDRSSGDDDLRDIQQCLQTFQDLSAATMEKAKAGTDPNWSIVTENRKYQTIINKCSKESRAIRKQNALLKNEMQKTQNRLDEIQKRCDENSLVIKRLGEELGSMTSDADVCVTQLQSEVTSSTISILELKTRNSEVENEKQQLANEISSGQGNCNRLRDCLTRAKANLLEISMVSEMSDVE